MPVQPMAPGPDRRSSSHVLPERPRTTGSLLTVLAAAGQLGTSPPRPVLWALAAAWALLI